METHEAPRRMHGGNGNPQLSHRLEDHGGPSSYSDGMVGSSQLIGVILVYALALGKGMTGRPMRGQRG